MKIGIYAAAFALSVGLGASFAPALAGPYDAQWIRQCVADNKDEGQTSKTVLDYCTCMVNLMPEAETRSVTQWERTHKKEENLCGAKAGWAGK